jgi:hypothetical protein
MANYLNRPSIFEIATAFENGQEGIINPQNDGDGYKKVYNQLTEEEKSLSYRHPVLAVKIKKNREKAFRATSHFDGITDGYGDAIRHCYWCALNQVSAGLNSPNAKKFGDAHEDIPNNHAKAMDLYNNSVGYYLGNQAIINGWNEEELLNQVINAANNGKLYILK